MKRARLQGDSVGKKQGSTGDEKETTLVPAPKRARVAEEEEEETQKTRQQREREREVSVEESEGGLCEAKKGRRTRMRLTAPLCLTVLNSMMGSSSRSSSLSSASSNSKKRENEARIGVTSTKQDTAEQGEQMNLECKYLHRRHV